MWLGVREVVIVTARALRLWRATTARALQNANRRKTPERLDNPLRIAATIGRQFNPGTDKMPERLKVREDIWRSQAYADVHGQDRGHILLKKRVGANPTAESRFRGRKLRYLWRNV